MSSPEDYLSPNTVILGDETLTGDAASFTAVSIPSGYATIRVKLYLASNSAGSGEGIKLVLNGLTTGECSRLYNDRGTAGATNSSGTTLGMVSVAGYWSSGWAEINNPDTTNKITYQSSAGGVWDGSSYDSSYFQDGVSADNGPLSTVTVSINADSFIAGSRMTVIGIK